MSLVKLRNEINNLKSDLSKIRNEKENWFKEKEGLKKQISDSIKKVKTVKQNKDSFNIVFDDLKINRDKLNNKVKGLIEEIKKLRDDRKKIVKELGIRLAPGKIRDRIKFFEEKIETEVLSLKKEQKFMQEIKDLRKAFGESKIISEVDEKIENLSELINKTKDKAQEYHIKLKEHLKKHKKSSSYKDFISLSRQIEFLKSSQQKAFNMFIDFKNKFLALNKLLRYKLFEERSIKGKLENRKIKQEQDKQKKEKELLDKKYKEVEEKLKTKKKLTTKDLLK